MALTPPIKPMLAEATDRLPAPDALPGGLAFEPKYDGYRLIIFRTGGSVYLQSRNGRDLTTAFPEIAEAASVLPEDVVLDGEVVILIGERLEFGALQQRVNRPAHTTKRLAHDQPAHYIAFDLLMRGAGDLRGEPYRRRRTDLEDVFSAHKLQAPWTLAPMTTDREQAESWLTAWPVIGVEGVMAKGLDQPYLPGRRGWYKVRAKETAEGIIGAVTGPVQAPHSVLLGRYDTQGTLHLVARGTPLSEPESGNLGHLVAEAGPGHPWAAARFTTDWGGGEPLEFTCVMPTVVAEFQGGGLVEQGTWRHPVRLLRVRVDVDPGDVPPFGTGQRPGEG